MPLPAFKRKKAISHSDDLNILPAQNLRNLNDKLKVKSIKKSIPLLYQKLAAGDIRACMKIYENYVLHYEAGDFFDDILRLVAQKIKLDWTNGRLNQATMHVVLNTAQCLVDIVIGNLEKNQVKPKHDSKPKKKL